MQLFPTSFLVRTAAMACVVLLGACAKKNDPSTPATTADMTWTADNTNYSSTFATVTVQGTDMVITGVNSVSNGVASNTISLLVPTAKGTYNIATAAGTDNYLMSYNVGSTNPTAYVASNLRGNGSGTVVITTFSTTEVVGTFSFTGDNASGGTDKKAVTNGKFSIKR